MTWKSWESRPGLFLLLLSWHLIQFLLRNGTYRLWRKSVIYHAMHNALGLSWHILAYLFHHFVIKRNQLICNFVVLTCYAAGACGRGITDGSMLSSTFVSKSSASLSCVRWFSCVFLDRDFCKLHTSPKSWKCDSVHESFLASPSHYNLLDVVPYPGAFGKNLTFRVLLSNWYSLVVMYKIVL